MSEAAIRDGWRVIDGDCVEAMRAMPEASVDAVVCDPPYGLEFMGKDWDRFASQDTTAAAQRGEAGGFGTDKGKPWHKARSGTHGVRSTFRCRRCGGWSGTFSDARRARQRPCECVEPDFDYAGAPQSMLAFQAWCTEWATEALRVLKPGGHLLAFGGTRTYHRLTCAVEDAGFEVRDCLAWLYGSGFPKSLDVSRAIDKAAGAERQVVGPSARHVSGKPEQRTEGLNGTGTFAETVGMGAYVTAPATPDAERWQGWGTALKPAHEPIVLARKPLIGTVARNVLVHGTGALNVDGCRIDSGGVTSSSDSAGLGKGYGSRDSEPDRKYGKGIGGIVAEAHALGRWPANVALSHTESCQQVGTRRVKGSHPTGDRAARGKAGDGYGFEANGKVDARVDADGMETVAAWVCAPDCPVRLLDEQTGEMASPAPYVRTAGADSDIYGDGLGRKGRGAMQDGYGDRGGASRFFYVAKASSAERNAGLDGFEPVHRVNGNKWTDQDYRVARGERPRSAESGPRRNVHPTVKPVDLMRWLVRLVTPPGGTVLDPFAGSGTTGIAAVLEGFGFVGIEREAEHVTIARARIEWWSQFPVGTATDAALGAGATRDGLTGSGQLDMFG
jgi:DNA modification methylase